MAVRIDGPIDKRRGDKSHRYALETDTEAMKAIMFTAKDEIHSISQALDQVKRNIDGQAAETEKLVI